MCPRREDRARRRARALRRTLGAPESPAGKVAPDPLEFLARLLTHIPDPGQVMTRYYGWYASRTRGMRRRQAAEGAAAQEPVAIADPVNWSLRAARYRWAELLRRIYDDSDFTRIPAYLCRRADGEPVDRRDCRGAGCSGAVDFNTATAEVTPCGAWFAGSRPDGRNVLAVRGLRRRGDARHGPGRRIVHP